MSLFIFLTVVQALVAAALVGIILIQRSEGGGLGVGGSPSGIMSARGAADFLTRTTAILATLFVLLSIMLAALAVDVSTGREIDTSLERGAPATTAPIDPLAGVADPQGESASSGGGETSPQTPAAAPDPLAGAAKR
ncbi:MAG: preprotein translocase subunit SecG [Novosphingobium sp.]|nr:preprotein translocase subunit SecG [Novosphingobium sp.]